MSYREGGLTQRYPCLIIDITSYKRRFLASWSGKNLSTRRVDARNEILGWIPTGLARKGIQIDRPDSNLHAEPEPTPQDGYGKTGKHFGLGS